MTARRTAAPIPPVLLLAACGGLLVACGDAPRKVDPSAPRAQAHSADDGHGHAPGDGHDHSADDGHGHGAAPADSTGIPSWSGVIVLRGPRAEGDAGVLMVSLVSRGQRMPRMTYRIPLVGQPPAEGGERRIAFRLDETTDMLRTGLPPELKDSPLDLSVRFDQDGVVETREGDVTVVEPVGWGGEGLEIAIGG